MKKTFTKKDLRNGDIVVTRSGEPGVVILDKEIIIYQNSGFDDFDMFTDDLMSDDDIRQCDIMEVYQGNCGFGFLDYDGVIPVFERVDTISTTNTESKPAPCDVEKKKKDLKPQKSPVTIVAQAFYGNRTATRITEEEFDRFILGFLDFSLSLEGEKVDRTLIPIPGTDNLVLIYNKYQEEEKIRRRDMLLKNEGIKLQPLAVIPELDITLYSRCIVCRKNEKGEYVDLENDDYKKFMHYLPV